MHDMNDNDEKTEEEAIEQMTGKNRAAIINNCNRCCHQNQSLTMIDSSPITAGEG
jgi:hypothetical protein